VELDDVPWELVRGVYLGRAGGDPLARELPDEVAQLPLLAAQDVPGHGAMVRGVDSGGTTVVESLHVSEPRVQLTEPALEANGLPELGERLRAIRLLRRLTLR